MKINKPKYDNPSELESTLIDNKIRNLILTDEQKIAVSVDKEKAIQDKKSFHLSPRTKYFTSRFDILHH